MACRLVGAKPLSEPMMDYCQLDPCGHISMKFWLKHNNFHWRKCIWKCRLCCLGPNVLNGICMDTYGHMTLLRPVKYDLLLRYSSGHKIRYTHYSFALSELLNLMKRCKLKGSAYKNSPSSRSRHSPYQFVVMDYGHKQDMIRTIPTESIDLWYSLFQQ